MSRFRNAARSLASGYLAMGSNVLYTLASVPLALHFLSKEEFGLWALATQVVGYLLLIDLGMSGAVGRILIDHKDRPNDGEYGSVIKTSCLVLLVQGFFIIIGGALVALCLPSLMNVPAEYVRPCRILVAVLCGMSGAAFVGRILMSLLQAHQRFDAINYSQILQMMAGLATQWITFERGMGLYSLLVASGVFSVVGLTSNCLWVIKLRLLPSGAGWGSASRKVFKEVFSFGGELFLLSIGSQLLNASQVIVITRTLGLTAAAVWTVATKIYPLALQLVCRIFDFSSSALGEMVVRGEQEGLRRRFRDVFLLTASAAVFVATGVAVCNGSFLEVWTGKRISWDSQNNLLLGGLLIVTCITRCHVGLLGPLKRIGGMRYVYVLEGITFVAAAFFVAPRWGLTAVLIVAIAADVVWTGIYGFRRTAVHFRTSVREVLFDWLASAWVYLGLMALIGAATWWSTLGLPPLPRLITQAGVLGMAGMALFWRSGLNAELRLELSGRLIALAPGWARRAGAALGI